MSDATKSPDSNPWRFGDGPPADPLRRRAIVEPPLVQRKQREAPILDQVSPYEWAAVRSTLPLCIICIFGKVVERVEELLIVLSVEETITGERLHCPCCRSLGLGRTNDRADGKLA